MAGTYDFWYCNQHDDGILVYTPSSNSDSKDNTIPEIKKPDWLNSCYKNQYKTCNDFDIVFKGHLECNDDGNFQETNEIQKCYEREAGGFKFKYYLLNMYDCDGNVIEPNKDLLIWFADK